MTQDIIDIRRFAAPELLPLLQAESRAWSLNLRWDYGPSVRMISSYLEEKRLSGYALVRESGIRGYCLFFYDGDKGVIGNLFVDLEEEGPKPATLLLEHALETLVATPGLARVETQLPHFDFEDLDPFFRARRFECFVRRFMAVSLKNREEPSRLRRDFAGLVRRSSESGGGRTGSNDFSIEPWERKHDRDAARLLYLTYRCHVDALINDQYAGEAGAVRLIENIVHHRGCGENLPSASRVAIHRSTQKLAGILALTAVRPQTAHIPQIAVAQEFQSSGLGTVLMETSFEDLFRRGYEEVSLTVTDSNTGAVRLYERLGFQTFRTFGAFVWNREKCER